ncbi:NifB/NifX family molybdenum-iron cluster-binding protein [Ilyobacter polytropus]|uniref:Dinitrogenase iron-molybdenum cofactor biosynthesis protein n=1 Tax=Ilyobacter polytropus (strain ATCC 51220 / DSM 2926 / LMG 16218 / CuHBu1) TaxID=572544 RepID=E3H8V3_ILYPC|nr:NifB/NifX family molybdenum-iron cluster-binding protein [Ilyobacter polytropus]ADO83367.1 Dinitrogenase iron-molybdenum cofactor biosynthesis protein [Ilyobacter polytropus DSM 2926]
MKIAVASKGEGLKAEIDNMFGRAEYFVIVDSENTEVKSIENTAKNESNGAGGKAVKLLSNEGVEIIVAPELGPKAVTAVEAFKIKAYKKDSLKTVEEAVKAYKEGKLIEFESASVREHSGLRRA